MQGRAIFEAAVKAKRRGIDVRPEIMIPLVATWREFENQRAILEDVAQQVLGGMGEEVAYTIGTMIELPRAALTADEIARKAEFFSFGTNDLTQTTFGLSRDDAGRFLPNYIDRGILPDDPFQVLDRNGVGKLIGFAVSAGRSVRPALKVGICGEHGGEPRSVKFCHSIGLDYVSCSPYRVPIARLAAAHAALEPTAPAKPRTRRSHPALPNLPDLEFLQGDERPLRIALVTEYYYPHLGGVCEHVHFFAREARRRGHHVDIITSHIPGAEPQPNVIRLGRSQPVYANGSQARITIGWNLRRDMRRVLREGRYDIVHVHSPLTPVLPLLAIEEADVPVVGTFHTYFDVVRLHARQPVLPEAARHASRGHRRLAQHDRRAEPVLRSATGRSFRTASTPTSSIRALLPRRASTKDVPTILFLGRFDPRNGLTTLIDSFRQVKSKGTQRPPGAARRRRRRSAPRALLQAGERRQGHHVRRRGARGTSELLRAQLRLRLPHHQGVVRHHAARGHGLRDAGRLLRHPRLPRRRRGRSRSADGSLRRSRRARRRARARARRSRVSRSSSARRDARTRSNTRGPRVTSQVLDVYQNVLGNVAVGV